MSNEIDKVDEDCEIWPRCREPMFSRKVSLTHFDAVFNQEIQIDLNITDKGTGRTEICSIQDKTMATMSSCIERVWIRIHGEPQSISGDDALDKLVFHCSPRQHNIIFKPRPSWRHNQLGHVERKNPTIKTIIKRLDKDIHEVNASTIIARAVFLSNLFSGSRTLSSFQLTKR